MQINVPCKIHPLRLDMITSSQQDGGSCIFTATETWLSFRTSLASSKSESVGSHPQWKSIKDKTVRPGFHSRGVKGKKWTVCSK